LPEEEEEEEEVAATFINARVCVHQFRVCQNRRLPFGILPSGCRLSSMAAIAPARGVLE
jgi:hypothetical protein